MTRPRCHPRWSAAADVERRRRLLAFGPALLFALALAWPGVAAAGTSVHEANDVPRKVPETGTAGAMATSIVSVDDADEFCSLPGATVRDVDVRIDLLHDFNADVTVWLTSPEGTTLPLFSRLGGSTTGMSVILDDEAPEEIAGSVTDFTARRPQSALAGPGLCRFDGQPPLGDWQLDVHDWLGGGVGYLSSWALTLTCETEGTAKPCATAPAGEEPAAEDSDAPEETDDDDAPDERPSDEQPADEDVAEVEP